MTDMDDGLVTAKSGNDFSTTVSRLTAAIMAESLTLFAVIDHREGLDGPGRTLTSS